MCAHNAAAGAAPTAAANKAYVMIVDILTAYLVGLPLSEDLLLLEPSLPLSLSIDQFLPKEEWLKH